MVRRGGIGRNVFILRAGISIWPLVFQQAAEPQDDPEKDRKSDCGCQTGGEEPSGTWCIQKSGDKCDNIHRDEQHDTYQCGDLFWSFLFHKFCTSFKNGPFSTIIIQYANSYVQELIVTAV